MHALKVECLAELEHLSEHGQIDLYYGDQSGVSLDPCAPYAWQFADEQVAMPAARGGQINCFALLSHDNHCLVHTTPNTISGDFITEQLDRLSFCVSKPTVVVLDNAPIHHGKAMRQRRKVLQERVVERAFSWLASCRSILVRSEKLPERYLALVKSESGLLWFQHWHEIEFEPCILRAILKRSQSYAIIELE